MLSDAGRHGTSYRRRARGSTGGNGPCWNGGEREVSYVSAASTDRIVYQNGGFYSCLECITMVVSGVRGAFAGCGH